MRKYTDPEAHGFLMEAKACGKIEKELNRLIEKYKKAVDREEAARQKEFETVLGYRSEGDIQEAYGWEFITEKQYERYLEIFRNGADALKNHEKSVNELVLSILQRINSDIARDRRQWESCALSPEEQEVERKRAEESQKAWKKYIAELKRQRGIVDATPGS